MIRPGDSRGAVESRLKLLRQHGPQNLILALSKSLNVDEEALEEVPAEVYVFRSAPIAREVLKILRKFEGKQQGALGAA